MSGHYNDRPRGDFYGGGGGVSGYDRGPPPRYSDRGPPDRYNQHRGGGGGGRGGYHHQDRRGPPPRGRGGYGGGPPRGQPRKTNCPITFNSFEEEREWVEERRRKRLARTSKFDVLPNAADHTAADLALAAIYSDSAAPQQTRHARRLYVGNLPLGISEEQIHQSFKSAIEKTLLPGSHIDLNEDPILTVYINQERRFSFVEFKSVELCNACMALDGLEIQPGHNVKVKRPNDYIPTNALMSPNAPVLDVSRLGIISSSVLDGPNKVFIGGLPYHLQDNQVMELLAAFGKIKAFHLVKENPEAELSKGYCFVEYADPSITNIAVEGLNGMDIGGGKNLTARLAADRVGGVLGLPGSGPSGVPPPNRTIVAGYDVEALVDAALGHGSMPQTPTYVDPLGQPLTRIVPTGPVITNHDLAMTLQSINTTPTRVLVLLNMVTDDDLGSDDDHKALMDEVRDECAKLGRLESIQIPRKAENGVEASAIRKVFLEYESVTDAQKAEQELKGRQFGNNVVQTEFLPEDDYAAGRLR